MKKFVLSIICALFIGQLSAQDFTELKGVMLKDSVDYADALPKVIECCDYLLSTSVKNDENQLVAYDYLVEWLNNNPYYNFSPNKKLYKIIGGNASLTARYFASLCKVAIDSKYEIKEDELQYQAIDKFVRFCMYKKYKVEVDKKLQKYIDAKKDGKLKEMI